jgi:hypothetical protein
LIPYDRRSHGRELKRRKFHASPAKWFNHLGTMLSNYRRNEKKALPIITIATMASV